MVGDRLRIAVFSDSAFPILNGVSVSVDALISELRHQGHSVHLYTARYPHHRDPDPNTFRFRALETPWSKGYPIAIPPFYRMLLKFREHSYDILHTHTPYTLGMVALRWAESHELPIVSTYHTLYDRYAHYIKFLPRRYVRFRIAKHTNFYYSRVQHVITPSDAALKWLRRHSVQTPATMIPTGAGRRRLLAREEERADLGIPPEQRILLFVGRLAEEKNLSFLFRAAHLAMRQDPLVRLWLVGDGAFRSECTAIVRHLGIGDRVRFVGSVPRTEVDRYYAASDLFVFTSISETQGLVVQEAMTYGLPAVVLLGGGASEAIVDGVNGIIVRGDEATFAETLVALLADDLLHAKLSANAARSVGGNDVSAMVEKVLGVYQDAIQSHRLIARSEESHAWI